MNYLRVLCGDSGLQCTVFPKAETELAFPQDQGHQPCLQARPEDGQTDGNRASGGDSGGLESLEVMLLRNGGPRPQEGLVGSLTR